MIQHGQVFKLRTKGVDGQPLWAYRLPLRGAWLGTAAGGRLRQSRGGRGGASEGRSIERITRYGGP